MGHLGNLKQEYRAWVRRLESGTAGLPEPSDPAAWAGWKETLEILCTPEQAWLASKMPVLPSPLERVARHAGLEPDALRPRLEALCDRGVVMDLVNPRTGETTYFLSPSVIGFVEFSMMRSGDDLPRKRLAEAMEAYMLGDDALAKEVFGKATKPGRALVHEATLGEQALPEVLDWDRATALVRAAPSVGVSLCYCRHKAQHLGKACEAPVENCLTLDAGSSFLVRRGFARLISNDEALRLLEEARARGLVQIADNVRDEPSFICNCCGCCCGQLQAINVYGLQAVSPSAFVPAPASDRCTGCGQCAEACPIGALRLSEADAPRARRPLLDAERCIGCGVCASRCRRGALTLQARPERPPIPRDTVERVVRMALERGRLAHFVFDEGAGRGAAFLNRVLKALAGLPPARRALANEQLRSRFVAAALAFVRDPTR